MIDLDEFFNLSWIKDSPLALEYRKFKQLSIIGAIEYGVWSKYCTDIQMKLLFIVNKNDYTT